MARNLYGVFLEAKDGRQWGMTHNKRIAIKAAKKDNGTVRRMANPSASSWDSPTFWTCSEHIWPVK